MRLRTQKWFIMSLVSPEMRTISIAEEKISALPSPDFIRTISSRRAFVIIL